MTRTKWLPIIWGAHFYLFLLFGAAMLGDGQWLFGALMISITVVIHVSGLVFLIQSLNRLGPKIQDMRPWLKTALILVAVVLLLIGLHMLEALAWALLYFWLGEFNNLDTALYFSLVTATTLGFGDITLSEKWRLLSTFEAMGGLILFGASTGFMLDLMHHLFKEIATDQGT